MTNAYASMHGRSLASTLDVGVAGTVDRLRTAWTKYVAYRKALAELRDLPTRALRDLAFNRGGSRPMTWCSWRGPARAPAWAGSIIPPWLAGR